MFDETIKYKAQGWTWVHSFLMSLFNVLQATLGTWVYNKVETLYETVLNRAIYTRKSKTRLTLDAS